MKINPVNINITIVYLKSLLEFSLLPLTKIIKATRKNNKN
jgi:hypothetical protein